MGDAGDDADIDIACRQSGIGGNLDFIRYSLSRDDDRVIGAEIVPEAIEDAKKNAERNGVKNASFFCGDASDIAAKLQRDGLKPDVVCVDPPRKGLAEDVIATVAAMDPRRVVYVSCDPATLGRDVKRFSEHGYEARRAAAVDMFPGTVHVESVVLLEKQ